MATCWRLSAQDLSGADAGSHDPVAEASPLTPRSSPDHHAGNGSEFASHEAVAKAATAATYFCDPTCSGERGTYENTNVLVRQYFPKGTDFRQVTDAELRKVVNKLNDRSRKRLGYRTPAQVFLGEYTGARDTAGAALIA